MRPVVMCSLLAPLAIPMTAAAEVRYTVTNLGFQPAAINNRGQIVGTAGPQETGQAVEYDGTLHDLGTPPGSTASAGVAISQNGIVLGVANNPVLSPSQQIYRYEGGWIHVPNDGKTQSIPYGINSSRHITGSEPSLSQGFYFDGKTYNYYIGTVHYQGVFAINDHDQLTGFSSQGDLFVADAKAGTGAVIQLGGGRPVFGAGIAINESGDVAGSYTPPGTKPEFASHAFLYAKGMFIDIAGLGGLASGRGINDSDQVVGYSSLAYGVPPFHAILYDGSIHDLNDVVDSGAGWLLEKAIGINDAGEIIGTGTFMGQPDQGFLLTPIPEPTSVAGLLGMAALSIRRRNR